MRIRTQARMRRWGGISSDDALPVLASLAQHQPFDQLTCMVTELTHDIRQPLTSLNMNLQSAIRLLQQPNPRTEAAIEALADCLGTEHDVVDILARAQQRFEAMRRTRTSTIALNGLVRDLIDSARIIEPSWRVRLRAQLAAPSPFVHRDAARLRLGLLSIVRRALIVDEKNANGPTGLTIETRCANRQAELSVDGLSLMLPTATSFHALLALTRTLVGHLGGTTRLALRDSGSVLTLSLPEMRAATQLAAGGGNGS